MHTKTSHSVMTPSEKRSISGLALVYACRMIGLFMVLPLLSVYGQTLTFATTANLGLALGIYGAAQALLQIPFGMASDRFGRKPIIVFGLMLFFCGSLLAAGADDVWTLICGRALQGSGAVAAVIMALAADQTRDHKRTIAMAVIGGSIGLAFMLSLIIGPVLASAVGLAGVFSVTAGLAVLAIFLVIFLVPAEPARRTGTRLSWSAMRALLQHHDLLRLDVGIFALHAAVTAVFVIVPPLLHEAGITQQALWQVYLGVVLAGLLVAMPLMRVAEARQAMPAVFRIAVLCMLSAVVLISLSAAALWQIIGLCLFFAGFTALEALLPSAVSRFAPASTRGAALGVYSTCQFTGAFVGGAGGGILAEYFGSVAVGCGIALLLVAWLLALLGMRHPRRLRERNLSVEGLGEAEQSALAAHLRALSGIADAVVVKEEQMAYLKVEHNQLDEGALSDLCRQYGIQSSAV